MATARLAWMNFTEASRRLWCGKATGGRRLGSRATKYSEISICSDRLVNASYFFLNRPLHPVMWPLANLVLNVESRAYLPAQLRHFGCTEQPRCPSGRGYQ